MKNHLLGRLTCAALLGLLATGGWAADYAGYTAKSDKPLRYSVRLGPDEKSPQILIVLDESQGAGTGYDVAMADLNLNGKLGDDKPTTPTVRQAERTSFRLVAETAFRDVDPKAKYSFNLNLYSQGAGKAPSVSFLGYLDFKKDGEAWQYLFICKPVEDKQDAGLKRLTLGSTVALETKAEQQNISPTQSTVATALWGRNATPPVPGIAVSATIKDSDGETLRLARRGQKEVPPHLALKSPSGKSVEDKDMEYG